MQTTKDYPLPALLLYRESHEEVSETGDAEHRVKPSMPKMWFEEENKYSVIWGQDQKWLENDKYSILLEVPMSVIQTTISSLL